MSEAANAVLRRSRDEWEQANSALVENVTYAARTKTHLPDGYWQAEHNARLRLQAAMAIAAAFEDVP